MSAIWVAGVGTGLAVYQVATLACFLSLFLRKRWRLATAVGAGHYVGLLILALFVAKAVVVHRHWIWVALTAYTFALTASLVVAVWATGRTDRQALSRGR